MQKANRQEIYSLNVDLKISTRLGVFKVSIEHIKEEIINSNKQGVRYTDKELLQLQQHRYVWRCTPIRHIRMDNDSLPSWDKIIGLFSIADGEILRYILHAKIPLEKLIRHELAERGYDENHRVARF